MTSPAESVESLLRPNVTSQCRTLPFVDEAVTPGAKNTRCTSTIVTPAGHLI